MSLREFADHMAGVAESHRRVKNPAHEQAAELYQQLAELLWLYEDAAQFADTDTRARLEAKFKPESLAIMGQIEELKETTRFQQGLKYWAAQFVEGSSSTDWAAEVSRLWGEDADPGNIRKYVDRDPA